MSGGSLYRREGGGAVLLYMPGDSLHRLILLGGGGGRFIASLYSHRDVRFLRLLVAEVYYAGKFVPCRRFVL